MYRVIKYFTDLQDDNHPYKEGDTFPRKGLKVSNARIAELSGDGNKQHCPLIEKVGKVGKVEEQEEQEEQEHGEDKPVEEATGKAETSEK